MSASRRLRAVSLDVVGWVVAGVAAVIAGVWWHGGRPVGEPTIRAAIAPVAPVARAAPDTIAAAAHSVVESDPFRFDRRPTAVAYRPELEGVTPLLKPPPPPLALVGLVGSGRGRWAALLDGIPGHTGTALVHVGDTLAGLRVRRIGRDTVLVTGPDTSWKLTVRRAWQ